MGNFHKFIERLREQEGAPSVKLIAEIVREHAFESRRTLDMYGRYMQCEENTPIMTREFEGTAQSKINNKLANDYFGEIIDTKVGYMFGLPVAYSYDRKAEGGRAIDDQIQRFKRINNVDDLNAEFGKFAAMCGYDAGVCYIDKQGEERVKRIDPWEAIIISETNITEPEFGIIYYDVDDDLKRVEFYTDTHKYVYEGEEFTEFKLIYKEGESKPHLFDYCPLFGIPNNAELQGDGDKVFSLIDAYDRTISDMNSEVEQFRLAYLLFIGYEPDEETIENMIKTGALHIPDAMNGESINWLTKDLNPAYIDSHLDRIEANITRFAKHVNFTDAAFGRDITGPAMRYKLFSLETKSMYFERKHEAAMLYMFKVLGSAWAKKGISFDYGLMDLVYTRNIPVNLVDEANAATTLSGITSKRTALSTLSIVDDVDEEMKRIEQEAQDAIDLDGQDFKDDPLDDEENDDQKDDKPIGVE